MTGSSAAAARRHLDCSDRAWDSESLRGITGRLERLAWYSVRRIDGIGRGRAVSPSGHCLTKCCRAVVR